LSVSEGQASDLKIYSSPLWWDPVREARAAEQLGYDGIRVIDHFAVPGAIGPSYPTPHSLVTLGAAAAATGALALTQTMMCVSFRHPAELAQGIATLDRISGGRAELGLGAGWYRPEHEAFGYDFPSPGQRLEKLGEAAEICREMLHHRGVVAFSGKHYRAEFDVEWPETPRIPDVMIGGSGPRLLALAGAVADRVDLLHTIRGGRPLLDAEHSNNGDRVVEMRQTALRSGDRVGNRPAVSATIFASLTEDRAEVAERRRDFAALAGSTAELLADDLLYVVGTPDDLLRAMTRLAELGIDRVHVGPLPPDPPRTLGLLADLLPALRAL
jgi:alkanesulfonate monooxygenase SsuD/methylene tetrahydromethanopterin reductase-like flavin-dependent oxidoreductase (luciferase family)